MWEIVIFDIFDPRFLVNYGDFGPMATLPDVARCGASFATKKSKIGIPEMEQWAFEPDACWIGLFCEFFLPSVFYCAIAAAVSFRFRFQTVVQCTLLWWCRGVQIMSIRVGLFSRCNDARSSIKQTFDCCKDDRSVMVLYCITRLVTRHMSVKQINNKSIRRHRRRGEVAGGNRLARRVLQRARGVWSSNVFQMGKKIFAQKSPKTCFLHVSEVSDHFKNFSFFPLKLTRGT